MKKAGLDEAQAGIKIARININNLRYADDTTLMAESEEELKNLFESERGEWKVGLILNIQKTEIMASVYLSFIDISPGNLDSSLCFIQPSISHDVLCIEVK